MTLTRILTQSTPTPNPTPNQVFEQLIPYFVCRTLLEEQREEARLYLLWLYLLWLYLLWLYLLSLPTAPPSPRGYTYHGSTLI